ncbi:THO complex subunit 4-like [Cydia fagiglandana]|uniref:THO complex subunit 4-like n=1 Tax=Cydia fagiglandana TaxID=1458189 RepID=UPI002FEE0995
MSRVHLMRRTIPPVAGAVGGAGFPAGPKRAGSGGRPRRAGGRGGGGGGPLSSLDPSVSGAVAKSSPDDDVDEEVDEAGGGGHGTENNILFISSVEALAPDIDIKKWSTTRKELKKVLKE